MCEAQCDAPPVLRPTPNAASVWHNAIHICPGAGKFISISMLSISLQTASFSRRRRHYIHKVWHGIKNDQNQQNLCIEKNRDLSQNGYGKSKKWQEYILLFSLPLVVKYFMSLEIMYIHFLKRRLSDVIHDLRTNGDVKAMTSWRDLRRWLRHDDGPVMVGYYMDLKNQDVALVYLLSVLILIYLKKRNTSISSELMNLFLLCLSGGWSSGEMGILIMSMIFEKLVFSTHVRNMLMKLDHLARDWRENDKYSQNRGLHNLMLIYHGRKYKNHLQKESLGRRKNSYTGQLMGKFRWAPNRSC